MAKLRFFAKDDLLVNVPGAQPGTGAPPRYVGRTLVIGDDKVPGYPSTGEAFECDSESFTGRELMRRMRADVADGYGAPLTPADKATADACGVEFKAAPAPKTSGKARESESV